MQSNRSNNDYNRHTVDGHSYHNSEARNTEPVSEPLPDLSGDLFETLADLVRPNFKQIYTRSLSKADREDAMARRLG